MINFQSSGKRTLKNLAAGKLKIDVLDCTLANGSVTPTILGINWIPIKPATNAAFCAALVQKIIADKTYNADAISFTTQKAAVEGGYGAYTNATYLVIVDENHPNYRKLMRAADAGIDAPEEKDKDGKAVEQYVVIDAATGQPALHSACSTGTLRSPACPWRTWSALPRSTPLTAPAWASATRAARPPRSTASTRSWAPRCSMPSWVRTR